MDQNQFIIPGKIASSHCDGEFADEGRKVLLEVGYFVGLELGDFVGCFVGFAVGILDGFVDTGGLVGLLKIGTNFDGWLLGILVG